MPVIRHVLPVLEPFSGRLPAAEWSISPLDAAASAERLGPLVEASNSLQEAGPRPSLAGITGDLAGRAGRTARGFVAQRGRSTASEELNSALEAECLGLAVLIEAHGSQGRRFSIATLLVRPDMRRRGIAAALVLHALAHVRSCGGTEVCVETSSAWPAAAAFWQRFTTDA
jgi:GNAT superfamily N-acetyltransferase